MLSLNNFLVLGFCLVLFNCAVSPLKDGEIVDVPLEKALVDFSTLGHNIEVSVVDKQGMYHQGSVIRNKSGLGHICLNVGKKERCFEQNELTEVVKMKKQPSRRGAMAEEMMMEIVLSMLAAAVLTLYLVGHSELFD